MKKRNSDDYRIPLFGSIGGLLVLLIAGGVGVGIYSLISGNEWAASIPLGIIILAVAILFFAAAFGIIILVFRLRSIRGGAEEMSDFFASRIDDYEEHMLKEVDGCAEAYARIGELLPRDAESLIDLGCGTGLELSEIFKKNPKISVTGIDICQPMLNRLKDRFADKSVRLICGDFFTVPFGDGFDAAVSAEAMHHYTHEEKAELYKKIHGAIKPGGVFILCDYMANSTADEDRLFTRGQALRARTAASPDTRLHIDIPLTPESECAILSHAGFSSVSVAFRHGSTTVILARK